MNNRKFIVLIFLIIFLIGCKREFIPKEDVWLETKDDQRIKSTVWYSEGDKAVILVHMLGKDRNDWKYFAKNLNNAGITAIAIDLRGHGESPGNWINFNEQQFNDMVYDLKAARKKLDKERKDIIGIIGASIGANLALKYAAEDKEIKTLILLSPGIDYKSVSTEENIKEYNNPILIAASREDTYSWQSSNILYENATGEKDIFIGKNLGHGTDMLKSGDLKNKIIKFLGTTLK